MSSQALKGQSFKGECASPGFAAGTIAVLAAAARPSANAAQQADPAADPAAEARLLERAIARAVADLQSLAGKAESEAAEMLGFQVAMLEDEALAEPAFAAIAAGASAAAGWAQAMDAEIAGYEASGDAYFRARASDLADMKERVLDVLSGAAATALPSGAIVWADDITPSRFLSADWHGGAILLRKGSATSHVAMLARARGVPMIVGLDAGDIGGRRALVDARQGVVLVDPGEDEAARFEGLRSEAEARDAAAALHLAKPALTRDGQRIATLINVADPDELEGLDPSTCDGIGLVRTELLFEGRKFEGGKGEGGALPGEDEQAAVYARIVRWAAGRPVTFRTLDAGGDKPIPGLTPDGESNPFLGVRGVRLTLARPDVFVAQLRAMARAAALGPVEVMIPMVALPAELEAARALLAEACAALASEGIAHARPALGMMVEVPAAALTLDLFDAAFLSIGSNDLTQYVMAAGRDIQAVSGLADPAHEAVLRLIGIVAAHGARAGIKVSLCGDAGGDPGLIPLLLARGVRILSMSPRALGAAKQAIAGLDLSQMDGLLQKDLPA